MCVRPKFVTWIWTNTKKVALRKKKKKKNQSTEATGFRQPKSSLQQVFEFELQLQQWVQLVPWSKVTIWILEKARVSDVFPVTVIAGFVRYDTECLILVSPPVSYRFYDFLFVLHKHITHPIKGEKEILKVVLIFNHFYPGAGQQGKMWLLTLTLFLHHLLTESGMLAHANRVTIHWGCGGSPLREECELH